MGLEPIWSGDPYFTALKLGLVLSGIAVVAFSVSPSIFANLWGRKWRRTAALTGLGAVVFYAIWIFYLARTMPSVAVARNWNIAWLGLDTFEGLAALTSAILLHFRSRFAVISTSAFATSLCIDALFDITTAAPGSPLAAAVLEAVLVELPFAVLAGVLALKLLSTGTTASTPPAVSPPGPRTDVLE